eukprot:gene2787-12662_t
MQVQGFLTDARPNAVVSHQNKHPSLPQPLARSAFRSRADLSMHSGMLSGLHALSAFPISPNVRAPGHALQRSVANASGNVHHRTRIIPHDTASTSYPSRIGGNDANWPDKSSLYILRTDGNSCSRELVTGTGKLTFAYPSTQQHLLVWKERPRSVMVLKKLGEELVDEFLEVIKFLTVEEKLRVVVEPAAYALHLAHRTDIQNVFTFNKTEKDRLAEFVDFVVCLGGDGVILHASALFRSNIPPVIAFNLGSLGFLTNHWYKDFREDLRDVIYGGTELDTCQIRGAVKNIKEDSLENTTEVGPGGGENTWQIRGAVENLKVDSLEYTTGVMITLRMRLWCEIIRLGRTVPDQTFEVLNEVVIDRGSNSYLTNIECYDRNRFLTRVQADGVILSTPTGSTAYSLPAGSTAYSVSAGGSMVHPNVPAILFTPVCPHSLSFRPVVLPDYAELALHIPENARCGAWVSVDGRNRQELKQGDRVKVRMSKSPVPTINKVDLTDDWFDSLSRCFRWSDRTEQKALLVNGDKPLS